MDDEEEHDSEIDPAPVSATTTPDVDVQSSDASDHSFHSDDEAEASIEQANAYKNISPVMFTRPLATGSDKPPYELIDKMSYTEGKDRLVFTDFVYPRYRGRLKAGYTVFLVVLDYKTLHVDYRPLRS